MFDFTYNINFIYVLKYLRMTKLAVGEASISSNHPHLTNSKINIKWQYF